MPTVYGIANHTPDQAIMWLAEDYNVDQKNVHILPVGQKLINPKKHKVGKYVFLLRPTDLKNNERLINNPAYADHIFFLFGSPIRLVEFDTIKPLDYAESNELHKAGIKLFTTFFELKSLTSEETRCPVKTPDRTFLTRVIDSTQQYGSLLQPFLSFIYTLPSATHQLPTKTAICLWVYNNGTDKELEDIVMTLDREITVTTKFRDKLMKILITDEGKKYKEAFAEYRRIKDDGKQPSYDTLATKFQVSAYEMRYIKSIVDTDTRYSKYNKISMNKLVKMILDNANQAKAKANG